MYKTNTIRVLYSLKVSFFTGDKKIKITYSLNNGIQY